MTTAELSAATRTLRLAILTALVATTAACGGTRAGVEADGASLGSGAAPARSDSGRFLDSTLPTEPGVLAEFPAYSDPGALATDADVVFVGTIVGTRENTFELRPPAEESPSSIVTEYDGLIFEVEQALAGDLAAGDTFEISVPTVVLRDGSPRLVTSRLNDQIIEALRNQETGRHLVFASKRPGVDVFQFTTYGSFVEVDNDGNVGRGAPGTLFGYVIDGDVLVPHGYTIDLVSDWIVGNPPPSPVPPRQDLEGGD